MDAAAPADDALAELETVVEPKALADDADLRASPHPVIERITCAGPHDALQRQMTGQVMSRHDGEAHADPERSPLMAFVTEATLAIYRQWVADGKSLPASRVADMAAKYVCRGAL